MVNVHEKGWYQLKRENAHERAKMVEQDKVHNEFIRVDEKMVLVKEIQKVGPLNSPLRL